MTLSHDHIMDHSWTTESTDITVTQWLFEQQMQLYRPVDIQQTNTITICINNHGGG